MSFSISEPRTRVSISLRICMRRLILLESGELTTEDTGDHRGKQIPLLATSARSGAPTTLHFPFLFLEQSGCSALPGLSFVLRDLFHVDDVGSGLRQDMM